MNKEWLEQCAQAGEFLYGVFPPDVLMQMYEKREKADFNQHEMINAVTGSEAVMMDYFANDLPEFAEMGFTDQGYFMPYVPAEDDEKEIYDVFRKAHESGNPYAILHLDEDEWKGLLKEQEDVPFYIPDGDEIDALVTTGAISCNEQGD